MLGLGGQEILCLLFLGVLAAAVIGAVMLNSTRSGSRVAQLEEENRRLREENDRLRGHQP